MIKALDSFSNAAQYFSESLSVGQNISYGEVDRIAEELFRAYQEERNIFLFGNGGSASLASHLACDLGKGTAGKKLLRARFHVIALTDNIPTITAWANDSGYDCIFSEQLINLARPEDVLFAISGSGNSPNVLKALEAGREIGTFNLGLGGFEGGKMKSLCDLCLVIPSANMQIIEDMHLSVAHCLFSILRDRIEKQDVTTAKLMIARA